MGPAKKKRSASFRPAWMAWFGKFWIYVLGPGRPVAAIVLLLLGLSTAVYATWNHVRPRLLASGQYSVSLDKVAVTPQPNWIRADIRAEVFRDASLDGPLSILDDDLPERIFRAFSLHPWVAKVVRVRRLPLGRIEVELAYRRPVCMVDGREGALPVDAESVLLPSGDFSPIEKTAYPHLTGIATMPMGPAGQRWGDGRVVGGAEIAAALAPVWQQLKIDRIVPLPNPAGSTGLAERAYLSTDDSRRHADFLGACPWQQVGRGATGGEKIARLLRYLADHGTLDGRGGSQTLDIRSLPAGAGAGT